MKARLLLGRRRFTGRDLQRLFAFSIGLPGILLTVVGLRAWQLDGELADQRLRERVERAADLAENAVATELRLWQATVQRAQHQWPPSLDALPSTLREASARPGTVVLLRSEAGTAHVWPTSQVAYQVGAYQGPPSTPAAEALNRQARTLLHHGAGAAARDAYRELARSRGAIGGLPADLVGRHALARLALEDGGSDAHAPLIAFYRDLVHGQWRLEETRYRFYSEWARALLPVLPAGHPLHEWRAAEDRRLSLARASRQTIEEPNGPLSGDYLRLRDSSAPNVVLLVSNAWLRDAIWPPRLAAVRAQGFDVVVHGADGTPWFDQGSASRELAIARTHREADGGPAWQVSVSPRDPAALIGDVTRWRSLTLIMLVLVVGLLGFGTYLTSHVVRRELEVARMQADFVSAVSHEFRSPLTGIRQLGEMLLRGRVPDETRRLEYYTRITHESARLGRLVENLLQAARIEDGRQHVRHDRIQTADWLRAVVAEARTQPALRHATIEEDIPASLPAVVGDPQALASALHNLIDNAVKYSPDGTPVRCEARAEQGQVTIRVQDRGVGMSEDDRRHAFERFRRGRGAITAQVKGTGLGLSLVKDIVLAHGGQVGCDSRLGEGTTFSIRLAAHEDA